jgi:D-3-phosphoglycerate dehydrogenase
MMSAPEPLIRDFLSWIATEPRPYSEALERWRTSCPRLPVWEDAFERGFVLREVREGVALVEVTPEGRRFVTELDNSREPPPE